MREQGKNKVIEVSSKQAMSVGRTLAAWGLALVTAGALVGCGGGGGNSEQSTLGLGSDSEANAATVQGLVAVGAPVANATVTLTCLKGAPIVMTAGADGRFTARIDQLTPPCAVQAQGGTINGATNTQALYSVSATGGQLNVTPLTTLLVAHLAGEPPATFYANFTNASRASKVSTTTVNAAASDLRQYLIDTLQVPGASSLDNFNPITGTFETTATDTHDQLLEALAANVADDGLVWSDLEADLAALELPPCLNASGFCWPTLSYKVLAEGRANDKGEAEAKFNEHDVDIAIGADGSWTKSITYKMDKGAIKPMFNFDVDVVGRGLAFLASYQVTSDNNCGYATPNNEACYEALYGAMTMVCGANAGDDFVMLPADAVAKGSSAEIKKEAVTPLLGVTFDRIEACTKRSTRFIVTASGQVTDESDSNVTGLIGSHIGKDWSGKQIDRKFWKVSSGTRSKVIGVETGTKNGLPHFVVLVQQ
jgi:hypothetical protein